MDHKTVKKSKEALLEAIKEIKEREREARKTKYKIFQKQQQSIEEAD